MQSALTGAERYNKEQAWKRPIKVTANVTLSFCCPDELPLKAINHVQIYENAKPKVHVHEDMFHQRSAWVHEALQPFTRYLEMLFKNMQKQKNHRKTQGTSAAHAHDRARTHARKSRL